MGERGIIGDCKAGDRWAKQRDGMEVCTFSKWYRWQLLSCVKQPHKPDAANLLASIPLKTSFIGAWRIMRRCWCRFRICRML